MCTAAFALQQSLGIAKETIWPAEAKIFICLLIKEVCWHGSTWHILTIVPFLRPVMFFHSFRMTQMALLSALTSSLSKSIISTFLQWPSPMIILHIFSTPETLHFSDLKLPHHTLRPQLHLFFVMENMIKNGCEGYPRKSCICLHVIKKYVPIGNKVENAENSGEENAKNFRECSGFEN